MDKRQATPQGRRRSWYTRQCGLRRLDAGCPVLAFFARAGAMPPTPTGPFRCVNVPDSRPSQTARRTGHPLPMVMPTRSKAWATLYNRVGVVKRHVDSRRVLTFPSWKVWVLLLVLRLFLLMRPRPAFRIARWKLGSTNHLSGHFTSDHDSLFRLPDFLREARRPISPTMTYCFTRVAHGLPCMRTSCA